MSNSSNSNGSSLESYATALNGYVSGETDINTTLDILCLPIESQFQSTGDESAVQNSLYVLWAAFQNAVQQISYKDPAQQNFVDLIVAFTKRPTVERNGQPGIVWKDLPIFGWQWRDAWNFNAEDSTDAEALQQWLNLNAWTCQITIASQEQSIPALDYSLYGIWTIREGLENSKQPVEGAVEAAAIWFIVGASLIYDLSQQGKTFQGKMARPGELLQDRDWTGYSTDRWKAWADRLAEVIDYMSNESAAKLVWQARDSMAACESS